MSASVADRELSPQIPYKLTVPAVFVHQKKARDLSAAVAGANVRKSQLEFRSGGRQMRNPLVRFGAAVFFLSLCAAPVAGQQENQPQPGQGNRGVQVGVPDGRAAGDGGASHAPTS
jgi:hypothetical protein